jgi:hypothetical protein
MGKIFVNDDQLEDWVDAALGIQERYGIEKALGYVIGEKFYNLVKILHSCRSTIRSIDEERRKPNYIPIRERSIGDRKYAENLEETYEREKEIVTEAECLLVNFAALIKGAFLSHEIWKYFESHPRLGALGHIASEEEHDFMIRKGAVEHSLDIEIKDALIFGEMIKYFGGSDGRHDECLRKLSVGYFQKKPSLSETLRCLK